MSGQADAKDEGEGVQEEHDPEHHDDRRGRDALEVVLRAQRPAEDLDRQDLYCPAIGFGRKVTNVKAPMRMSGAASPMALAIARMIPVMIPGAAAGRTDRRTACQRVAPRA